MNIEKSSVETQLRQAIDSITPSTTLLFVANELEKCGDTKDICHYLRWRAKIVDDFFTQLGGKEEYV